MIPTVAENIYSEKSSKNLAAQYDNESILAWRKMRRIWSFLSLIGSAKKLRHINVRPENNNKL